jgi:hypothetical protein
MFQTEGVLTYPSEHLGDPCAEYVTDTEFLKHMIPHHQVAIDMSKEIIKYTCDPDIAFMARNIINNQTNEILYMENVLLSGRPNLATSDKFVPKSIPNQFDYWYQKESRADEYTCGLHHFSSEEAHQHEMGKMIR